MMTRSFRVGVLVALAACFAGCAAPVEIGANRELRVEGRPFFPLMNFYQSPASFDNAAAMGLNAYFMPGAKPPPKEYLDALWQKKLYGMVPFDAAAVGHPALLAWIQPHEPDTAFLVGQKAEMSPEKMAEAYAAIKAADPAGHPVVLDVSPEFMTGVPFATALTDEQKRTAYPAYAKAADVLTYNVYPVWGHNQPEKLVWVAQAADNLRNLVGRGKPFFAMIETTTGWREIDPVKQKPLSIDDIRTEVWMAITHGATGIIYFTHQFKPKFSEHGLDAARHAELKTLNEQITRLAPAILGADAAEQPTLTLAAGLASSVLGKVHGGQLYVFAQNIDMARGSGQGTIAVKGLKAGTKIEVVDEDRSITAEDGRFADEFAPLAVHIYRIKL
jgi:hypothetical protein